MDSPRRALLEALHNMGAAQLSPGASGNISVRVEGGMLISASGCVAARASEQDLCFVGQDLNSLADWPDDRARPSSEWRMHQALYARHPRAQAVVHCHSANATALACQRRAIPPFHYMVSIAGGNDIPCTDYALFGSDELSAAVCKALEDRQACLMANHGQICIADSPTKALALAREVEALAATYILSCQCGEPSLLSDLEMAAVHQAFANYGQRLR